MIFPSLTSEGTIVTESNITEVFDMSVPKLLPVIVTVELV